MQYSGQQVRHTTAPTARDALLNSYLQTRADTEQLCAPLETEDYCIQTMPDVSPAKWHLAHTSWFFETFLLEPHLSGLGGPKRGKIVVATVAGDIHDIGKNIFTTLMDTAGFEVIDLGVDVSAEAIVVAVREQSPDILGLSALLTTNLEQFPLIVEMMEKEGLRSGVKIVVGGATVTDEFAEGAGVDALAKSAVEGVNICKEWV